MVPSDGAIVLRRRPSLIDRATVAAALDRTGILRLALSLRRVVSRWIPVLTYHRVAHPADPSVLDDGVVDVTPAQFDRQMAFVRRWFRPVGIDALVACAAGRGRLPPRPLLVTFDDGYLDNHDVALPILVQHGIKATFFIATDYVERRRPYWWDRVSFVVRRSKLERIILSYPEREALVLETPEGRRAAVRRLQRIVKDRRGLDLERFLEGLERAAGVVLSREQERRLADGTIMTWEQISTLRRAGMDVQSHTHTHRVLQTLDVAEVQRELRLSRAALEDVLGESIVAVSYPIGKPVGADSHIRRAVHDAGYKLGFSNGTGVNTIAAFDPLDVKRVSMDLAIDDPFFRTILALPCIAY
jgi:peptidoglycan/xylan/chitin deacetylase (PgdA/CDA1 family)